jgi:hypothetical protein
VSIEPAQNIHMLSLGGWGTPCSGCPHEVFVAHTVDRTSRTVDCGDGVYEVVITGPRVAGAAWPAESSSWQSETQFNAAGRHAFMVKMLHPDCATESVRSFGRGSLGGLFACGEKAFSLSLSPVG